MEVFYLQCEHLHWALILNFNDNDMRNFIKYGMISALMMFASCEEFLDVDPPKDQIADVRVFEDDKMATAALNNLYVSLHNKGFFNGTTFGAGFLLGCYTDELEVTTNRNEPFKLFYDGTVLSSNETVKTIWNDTYNQIFMCNNIIEGIKSSSLITKEVKDQIIGECMTLRGILHFYLAQTYGNVPYVISTDYKVNQRVSKITVDEVIKRAISDLKEAEELLTDVIPTGERIRINRTVTQAFLARIYLYNSNWDQAKTYSEMVINNSNYQLEDLEKLFLKDSKSAIWQLKPLATDTNTTEAYSYIFTTTPAPNAQLSQYLLNAFEINDSRKQEWVKIVDNKLVSTHVNKYKIMGGSSPSKEYSIIIRIEEMYLIAAEATAEIADFEAAAYYLNKVRNRSGLENISISNAEEALDLIIKERRVEFFCEFGHRFYDLKRRNKLNDLIIVKTNWRPHFQLWPIPEVELTLNPNLNPQNYGY